MRKERDTNITSCRLKEVLFYSPCSGIFTWRTKPNRRIPIGSQAGTITDHGYVMIKIDGEPHYAHRLAFLYMLGYLPAKFVDHANCNRSDNRWINLRLADSSQNLFNSRIRSDNTSGIKGVCWDRKKRKWRAEVWANGVHTHIGYYADKEEARSAISDMRSRLHLHFANNGEKHEDT